MTMINNHKAETYYTVTHWGSRLNFMAILFWLMPDNFIQQSGMPVP